MGEARDHTKGLQLARLRELLDYDSETGVFTWKKLSHPSTSSIRVGDVAGSVNNSQGYIRIWIDGRRHLAHRLAWFYVHGKWPIRVDHRNCIGGSNRLGNLRIATDEQNAANRRVNSNNFLGIKGVRLHPIGRYQARIFYKGRSKSLGLFTTAEEAAVAYKNAAEATFGEFARTA